MSSRMKYSTFIRKVQKRWNEEKEECPFLCTIASRVRITLCETPNKSSEAKENYEKLREKFFSQISQLIDGYRTVGNYLSKQRRAEPGEYWDPTVEESNKFRAELLSKMLQQALYAERLAEEAKKVARYNKRRG